MSATRDSDTDLAKVFPDLKTMEREADPSRRRARLEQALNTPPVVDAALTILREGLKEGEDPLYYQVPPRERGQESTTAGAHGNDSDAAPSPWSTPAGEAVPKEMLPSASAPAAAPSATGALPVAEAPRDRGARRPGASRRSTVIAVLAVFGPLAFMWALLVRPQNGAHGNDPSASAAPTTAPSAPAVVSASAVPTVPPAPTVAPETPAPSASASAAASASASPAVPPPRQLPKPPHPKREPPKGAPAEEDWEQFR
jgi:hypothetical protein